MRRTQLPVAVAATCLVAGSTAYAGAASASAADSNLPVPKHVRCSHQANPPEEPVDPDGPPVIDIGSTTMRVAIKKMRGFRRSHEGKKVCVFKRAAPGARLTLSATYRPGTRAKMTKRYFKARSKPGFTLIRLGKGSKVPSSKGKRTVLEYTYRKHGKRQHVRVHGDSRVVFAVRSPQRTWKATKRSASKLRRSMRVHSLTAL
ncbi:hypothetical protein [Solicola gregarius]|uniref:Uncharacterized protein n=1 Tax=Solicola gregarius TaxID=2908642 RepID=A0AA46TEL1_9ACTN|nr:hypothetical protein [Solicola gregarius]UYM03805.1 hypothetical protein L0C25_14785 [Solicola gregarius]